MTDKEILNYLMGTGLYDSEQELYYDKKMLKEDKTISIRDLIERLVEVDRYYKGSPWNIQQILTNINTVTPIEDMEREAV